MSDDRRTSPLGVVATLVGVLCLAPTAMAVVTVISVVVWSAVTVGYLSATAGQEGTFFGLLGAVFYSYATWLIASPILGCAGLGLHPIGGLSGWVALRGGLQKVGALLMAAHGVTFVVALGAITLWGLFMGFVITS